MHFRSEDPQVDWQRLSNEFCDKFGLNQHVPVGKINATGFEFELNYMNYWLVLPVVVATQDGKDVTVMQFYDSKIRYAQIFAISIPLIFSTFALLAMIDMGLRATFDFGVAPDFGKFIGLVFSTSMVMGILVMILTLRRRLWSESLEKAEDLLRRVGVKPN